jgi:NADH-quinone oxidoreductase subunit L
LAVAVVFLPLLAAVIAGFFGRVIGDRGAEIVTCGAMVLSALLGIPLFREILAHEHAQIVPLATWIAAGGVDVQWSLRLDTLSGVMIVAVTIVSAMVHIYSVGYMAHDPGIPRFMAYLSLFTFFMLMLATANDFVQLFFGWEGVGLLSYLLIGFWYDRRSANDAAIKAFVVNRFGDFGFSLGIFAVFVIFGSLDFDTVFGKAPTAVGTTINFLGWQVPSLTLACILLFVGAMGKSAQLGLHTWLPDAMEGPTPVSALIHAATMVTAGVFMVARLSPLFEYAPTALAVVGVIGGTTAVFAASVGMAQNDIKRVIAYSTCSQLGYMFFAAGVSAYAAAMFHLFTHAFFKALLFLGAGSVIHAMGGEQDMRRMGGLRHHIPWTFWTMTTATFAIAGFPPFAGFFSKDAILWRAYSSPYGSWVYWLLGVFTAFLTSFYMFRLWFLTFFGEYRGEAAEGHGDTHMQVVSQSRPGAPALRGHGGIHESPKIMLIPLVILAVLSICGGWVGSERFDKFLSPALSPSVTTSDERVATTSAPEPKDQSGRETIFTGISVLAAVAGLFLAWLLYLRRPQLPQEIAHALGGFYEAVVHKYYVDEIYATVFVKPLIDGSTRILWQGIDRDVIDATLDNSAEGAREVSDAMRHMQSGNLRSYAGWIAAGAAAVIAYMIWMGTR